MTAEVFVGGGEFGSEAMGKVVALSGSAIGAHGDRAADVLPSARVQVGDGFGTNDSDSVFCAHAGKLCSIQLEWDFTHEAYLVVHMRERRAAFHAGLQAVATG